MKEVIQYLQEEYPKDGWIYTDPETFEFFRSLAKPSPKPKPVVVMAKPMMQKKVVEKVELPPPKVVEKVVIEKEVAEKPQDLQETLAAIRRTCKEIEVVEEIPKAGSKVLLFYLSDGEFVKKVAAALQARGVIAEVKEVGEEIESRIGENVRMILLPKGVAGLLKELQYSPETLKRSWRSASVLLLEEAALYEQDLYLKKGLWESLKSELGL